MEKPNITRHLLDSFEDLKNLVKYANDNKFEFVSLDTETDNISEHLAKLYGIGFYFGGDDAFYVPVRWQNESLAFADGVIIELLKRLTNNRKVITHNGLYDILVIENNYGLNLTDRLYHDTILSKHVIDEERPFGLKETALKYLGPWANKAQEALYENIKKNGGKTTKESTEMFKADTEVLAEYCCFDVILTFLLFKIFDAKMKEDGLDKFFYEDEVMPLYKEVTIDMKRRGFPVDVPYFQKLKLDIEAEINSIEVSIMKEIEPLVVEFEIKEVLKKVKLTSRSGLGKHLISLGYNVDAINLAILDPKELVNVPYEEIKTFYKSKNGLEHIFNLNSTHHLSWLFFEKLGIESKEKTESGAPKLDASIIEELAGEHPFADNIIEYKKLQKLLSTYIEGILSREIDGSIYASFLQFGTTSGRYSCTNPNLQNLPRVKDDEAELSPLVLKYVNAIKRGLIAGEGNKIVNADFSQLEPCCFAAVSGDKLLQQVFVDKQDLYSAIAIQVEGLQGIYSANKKAANYLKNHKPELRQKFKAIALGIVYGAEEYRVASLLECEVNEARDIIFNYLKAYPGLKNYMMSCDVSVIRRGEVVSKFGRKRHLMEAKAIYSKYGDQLLDRRWAKKNNLSETRWKLKNMLNLAKNHPIQGLASHIVNRSMIAVMREFKLQNIEGYIAASVHDEICCIVRQDQAELASKIVKGCMENTVKIEVPLVAEPLIANNWADAK